MMKISKFQKDPVSRTQNSLTHFTFHFTSYVKTFTFDQEYSSFQRINYFSFLVDLMTDDCGVEGQSN
jgi:hypothetical protein